MKPLTQAEALIKKAKSRTNLSRTEQREIGLLLQDKVKQCQLQASVIRSLRASIKQLVEQPKVTITVEQLVEQIRAWELDAGEGFTDYFLDRHSYDKKWENFLLSKGFDDLVQQIREDVYVMGDGTVLGCTDQQLKFEPYSTARDNEGLDWDEDTYRQDVALWAEFILTHEDVLTDYEEWRKEQNEPHEDDDPVS